MPSITQAHRPTIHTTDTTLLASRFKQGDRTVYGFDVSLEQIVGLLPEPDPAVVLEGNRAIRRKHAYDFADYMRENTGWVAPSLLIRARDVFTFEPQIAAGGSEVGQLTFPAVKTTDLMIVDGQHRILGFHHLRRTLEAELRAAEEHHARARKQDDFGALSRDAETRLSELRRRHAILSAQRVGVHLYVEDDLTAAKQMFTDIASNALGISSSIKSLFDSRKVVNRVLPVLFQHPLLEGRIDPERDRITGTSAYMYGATQVSELARVTNIGVDGRYGKQMEALANDQEVASITLRFLDQAVDAFAELRWVTDGEMTPEDLRKSSMLGSLTLLRVIAGAWRDLKDVHGWNTDQLAGFLNALSGQTSAPITADSIWVREEMGDRFQVGAMSPSSKKQDLRAAKDILVGWALAGTL